MRRAEELQEWICHVTSYPQDKEHLSVMLQNGQVLCMLANALDPDARLKVNKLTTVFHSKANVRVFLDWCRQHGLMDNELFQADDLLDGHDFAAVLTTLSILYERFGGLRYSHAYEENPLSDSESQTSSTSSGHESPKKTNKLTAFMKGGFLGRKKNSAKKKTDMKTPRSPPSPSGTPPMSPSTPPPASPVGAPTPPGTPPRNRSNGSGSGASNKLSAFLAQVPPSNDPPLEHMNKPAGPPKRAGPRKENKPPVNRPASPQTPPRELKKTFAPPPPQQENESRVANDPRNKFAAFMRSNPPAPKAPGSTGGGSAPAPPSSAPVSLQRQPSVDFVQKKAMFSPKAAKAVNTPGFGAKAPASTPAPRKATAEGNKLKDFMSKQPSSNVSLNKDRSDSGQSKLAAFIANTGVTPSVVSPPKSAPSNLHSFNPHASRPQPPAATSYSNTANRASERAPMGTFTPRRRAERSSGRCDYVRRRQTYWIGRSKNRKRFSLEEKRKAFMHEQLELKEEQMRRKAEGDKSKQNLIVPGVQCYVPDKDEVWLLSEVVDYNERTKEVTITAFLDDGEQEQRIVDLKNPDTIRAVAGPNATEIESLPIAIMQDTQGGGVEDMRLLRYLNEPSILFNLKQRFEASKPYTYTNEIVIAVNPYKWIDNLYGDHLHEQYLKKPRDSLMPHVYSTSTAAYKHMKRNEMNQSILVSGESGAGKTETTKIVMNHLASVAGGRMDKTIAKVIDVNPLLESFGNAKTTRNDNSSRFGKFTQLQFNERGKLIGAKCETYLLEKSRVVSMSTGERNYHIFYQMLAGLSSQELRDYDLDPSFNYMYTGELSEMKIPGMDDKEWLASTRKSLSLIGLDARAQKTLFQLLAGIMHLGEIDFSASGESGSAISNQSQLSRVAKMFGLPNSGIQDALCNRTVITRNDAVTVPLDPVEAAENKDALAKTIYSKLFDWMVQRINEAISSDDGNIHGQIGVLDIFGFEDFMHNGFEQFCINYANEKLQQKFTTDVFKTVEEEYIREGLQWDHIAYADNKDIVEIIDGKLGIIALMNDHLRQPRGTEEALVNKIKTNHHKKGDSFNPHIDFPKVKRTQFIINHYAGSVTYESVGFMEKHRDTLQKDLLDLIQSSRVDLLTELFDDSDSPPESSGARSKAGAKSLGTQFKLSLTRLMENISSTNTHYIRCIKPNSNKSPTEFNRRMVVEQLRSAGVIEAIRITRSGYPSRLTPHELATRYCIMFPPSMHSKDVRRTCTTFMTSIGRKAPLEYQMGKSLVYFKNGVMEELEAMKSDFMYFEATCIQKVVLGFVYRRRFARMVRAAIVLQSVARMSLERKEFHFQRRCIIKIQRGWRQYLDAEAHIEDYHSEAGSSEGSHENWAEDDDGDRTDDDEGFGEDEPHHSPNPAKPSGFSMMDRIKSLKNNMGSKSQDVDRASSSDRKGSLRRMNDLSAKAKELMHKGSRSSSGISLEEENSMLRVENRNLKYDLELMREQCIELQAIILEINKRKR
ncbi:TPA: hypothetical protein N0F65_001835 [Lagenidium giganteum]|uniref:Uncharacterized protein n=1 Tax=Lagenidium giganteum TaxID=4803 RepID=A0AAV2Z6F6_9STRA|nr:TPA: hypothetical protein N0F65_001835 [Lagenidium giganteum]